MIIPQAFYTTRGTPLSAYHRTKELIARGHEVDILTYAVGNDAPDLPARVYRSRGPHFRKSIEAGPSKIKIWFDLLLLINLFYRLIAKRYDVIYAHEEGAFLARFAGGLLRVPYIYDMHSSLPLQITDWKFSASRRVIGFFKWVERVCVHGARAIVAISPAVANVAREIDPGKPIVTIVNHFEIGEAVETDAAVLIRERYQIGPGQPIVLYTGSFVALQALDMLMDAIPVVARSVPNVVFLVVGGSDPEIEVLRAQTERLGIADKVIFDRNRPQKEMPTFMAAAQVLVSPRVQGINPPGKLLSYLASERPVVATDTLVHNQLLNHRCAILTGPDPEALAQGLVTALTDRARVASVISEAKLFLARYGSKAARDQAYDTLFAAVAGRAVAAAVSPARGPVARIATGPRLLTTSYEYPPLGGGGAKVAYGIAHRLVERGYPVDLITMGFRGLARNAVDAGVNVHRVPGIRMRIASCSFVEMIPYVMLAPIRLMRGLRQQHYRLNHAHFIFPDGLVAYLVQRLTGLPYVITAHGSDVPNYNPDRFKLLHILLLPLWRAVTRGASLIVCPSASIESLIKAKNPTARTRIIPNAIATDKFPPGFKQPRRLLVVTRFFERKGVQFVVRALASLPGRFEVDLVGNGPYLDTVKQLAADLNVEAKFWGHLDNDSAQLRELYQRAAVFVFTSEAENFPIVLLEAMTAGTAIVTTRGTGCEEVVADTGLLVPIRDADAIAAALIKLSESPELVERLGQAARQRAITRFGWDGVIDRHLEVYRELGVALIPDERDVAVNAAMEPQPRAQGRA
jgi:glycosyltransferase involved in cell wall biosynthesis